MKRDSMSSFTLVSKRQFLGVRLAVVISCNCTEENTRFLSSASKIWMVWGDAKSDARDILNIASIEYVLVCAYVLVYVVVFVFVCLLERYTAEAISAF